jgi:hypothetical protein
MPDDYDDDNDDHDERPRKGRRRRDDDDYVDENREEGDATGGVIPYKNPKALLAYYFGIFSFFVPVIGGIVSVVLGVMGLKYAKAHPKARGQAHAVVGIGCGMATALFWGAVLVLVIIGAFAGRR